MSPLRPGSLPPPQPRLSTTPPRGSRPRSDPPAAPAGSGVRPLPATSFPRRPGCLRGAEPSRAEPPAPAPGPTGVEAKASPAQPGRAGVVRSFRRRRKTQAGLSLVRGGQPSPRLRAPGPAERGGEANAARLRGRAGGAVGAGGPRGAAPGVAAVQSGGGGAGR